MSPSSVLKLAIGFCICLSGFFQPAWAGADLNDMLTGMRCTEITKSILGAGKCPEDEKSIIVAGSIPLLRYTRALKTEFEKKHRGLTITYGGGNSISSLIAVNRQAIDIAGISRDLKSKEMSVDVRAVLIGRDGVAVIVNPANSLANLSRKDIAKIFTGEIKTWPGAKGTEGSIVHVLTRRMDSATRQSFIELALDGNDITDQAIVLNESSDIVARVAADPAAIGYLALHDSGGGGKVLSVDGVAMNDATILSGRYPYTRPLYYVTKGAPNPLVAQFLNFATSQEGQAVIEKAGALRVH